jgi:hypothetical protein
MRMPADLQQKSSFSFAVLGRMRSLWHFHVSVTTWNTIYESIPNAYSLQDTCKAMPHTARWPGVPPLSLVKLNSVTLLWSLVGRAPGSRSSRIAAPDEAKSTPSLKMETSQTTPWSLSQVAIRSAFSPYLFKAAVQYKTFQFRNTIQ